MPILDDGTPVSGGAADLLTISYAVLASEIGDYLGIGRNDNDWNSLEQTRIDSIIQSGLRQVYYAPSVKPGVVHQWSWLFPEFEIVTTAEYDTGTIVSLNGVVTLSDGVWPSWTAEGELHYGSQVYTIASRDSDTQITLNDLTVTNAVGSTYSLARPTYDMPEGFDGSFDGDIHYKTDQNNLWAPIKVTSATVLRAKKQTYRENDRPLYASTQPKSLDATVGQRWQITFWPSPNAEWTLYGRYKLRPQPIDGTNEYPHGGTAMSEVYLESCLAVAEKRFVEDTKIHQEEYSRLIKQAIDNDADSFSADYLGYNRDRSDEGADYYWRNNRAIHSVEGVTYYDRNP